MALVSNTATLLGKELRTEFRSRELLTTTSVFILIVLVLFSFATNPGTEEARQFAPGLLWLAILFASSLMFQSCFLREQVNDTLSSLRLAVSELLMLPFFAIFYNITLWSQLAPLILVLIVGNLGIAIAGTAISAISAQARMRELLLPLLLLPLLTPVLVVSSLVTASLLDREPVVQWKGIAFLGVFDMVFLTALWLFGQYFLEE